MAAAAASTTSSGKSQDAYQNFNMKACINDLTKIPQKDFEAQFRNWMEKDGVARAMQAKLRADLIANFNKTNLGKHIIGQTPTNRLTLSPMELALNTLVAEFLFAQNCHFTLSVYSTEAPFRNTLPDFDTLNFRFKENEVTEIVKAICGPTFDDWNVKNRVLKNYAANRSTALLYFILKALLDKNAEVAQQKVNVGTNTKPFKMPNKYAAMSSDLASPQQSLRDSKAEFYNTNFRYLNRYLIILSRKVKDMSEQFERIQHKRSYATGINQPRVRVLKSTGRRKYEDLNRSLERVTENLKQMANANRKSKRISTIVKAIEALSTQFQKCAENFDNVSKDLRETSRAKMNKTVSSGESMQLTTRQPMVSATSVAASQTDVYFEKSFGDWLHEMRYTKNGQKFLDRVEKSFQKALEKQKRELAVENEIKLRHQRELLRIRYKQKVIEQICTHGNQSAHKNETQTAHSQQQETISEQFRQFELKHFDLLSKIYESESDNRTTANRLAKETPQKTVANEKVVHFNEKENDQLAKSSTDFESFDLKFTSSSDYINEPQQSKPILKERNAKEFEEKVKTAIVEIETEERNVDQIVLDAKLRIRELEHESDLLTENFLGYLNRQREQKLAAREAAQSLWNDYINEREKMQTRYNANDSLPFPERGTSSNQQNKELAVAQKDDLKETLERFLKEHKLNRDKPSKVTQKNTAPQPQVTNKESSTTSTSSESNSSYLDFQNPIKQAKEHFFEREKKFKATTEQVLNFNGNSKIDFDELLVPLDENNPYKMATKTTTNTIYPIKMTFEPPQPPSSTERQWQPPSSWITQFLGESLSGTNTDLSMTTMERATENAAVAPTSNVQLASNWQGSLERQQQQQQQQRPQNDSVNKSRRREIIATTKEGEMKIQKTTIETLKTFVTTAAAAATTTTTRATTTIPRALNKNKADGANVAEAQQEHSNNYKIKSDAAAIVGYDQKNSKATTGHQQHSQSDWQNKKSNNSNKTGNINLYASTTEHRQFVTEMVENSTAQTLKPPSTEKKFTSTMPSRKAVLKQTMDRMQQLFSPHHHHQEQQQQRKEQQMLTDLSEIEEEIGEKRQKGEKQSDKSKNFEIQQNKTNNTNTNNQTTTNNQHVDDDTSKNSKNVVGHYKNNLQLKQKPTPNTTTKTLVKKDQPQQQQQQFTEIPTTATATQKISHSIDDDGNKTVERMVDWQQIVCGPSVGRQNEAKLNATKDIKETASADVIEERIHIGYHDDDDDVDFVEKDIKPASEPGEVIEMNQMLPETLNQLEIGELIEQSDNISAQMSLGIGSPLSPFSASEVSSIDLRLSVGGGGDADPRSRKRSNRDDAAGAISNGSNGSDSDFWA